MVLAPAATLMCRVYFPKIKYQMARNATSLTINLALFTAQWLEVITKDMFHFNKNPPHLVERKRHSAHENSSE